MTPEQRQQMSALGRQEARDAIRSAGLQTKDSTTGEREEIARIIADAWPAAGQTGHLRTKDLDPKVALALADAILSRASRMAASSEGWVLVPADDHARSFSDSILPRAMIDAGIAVCDQRDIDNGNYVAGVTTDWDDGMVCVAIYRAMLAARPDAGREVEPVKMLVDQEWLARHGATDPDVSVEAGGAIGPLDWLAANQNCELSYHYGDADEDGKGWCVHRVNGGVNDREWTLIGTGETPEAATLSAIKSGN